MTMKSYSYNILKDLISGIAITTLGLPPSLGNFASISPKVLETFLIVSYCYYLSYIYEILIIFLAILYEDPVIIVFVLY